MRKFSNPLERRGHRFLLAALALMMIISPLLQGSPALRQVMAVLLTLVLLAAVRTVTGHAGRFGVALVLGAIALLAQTLVLMDGWQWLAGVRYAATLLFLFWVIGLLLADIVVRSQRVTADLILGSINVYLMAALAFAFVYALIEDLQPGSFAGLESFPNWPGEVSVLLYFSFITVTTLGYGDITPVTPLGLTATYVEAVFGQLYLAILVARLVGMYVGRRPADDA